MSSFSSDSQVIWYDSVIKNGELKWQNALNDNNRMFFNSCDGIFLNYNWKEEHLAESLKLAAERQTDVYVGVDVFGRGCLGGGGFSTDVAVAEARKFGLSIAIFAPGWVYECQDVEKFRENQFKFWAALQKYCPARTIIEFPQSSFCPGFGEKMCRNGEVISEEPWHNLGLQSLQPIYSSPRIKLDWEACNGGTCIYFGGQTDDNPLMFKIFETDLSIAGDFILSYTFLELYSSSKIFLVLQMKNGAQLNLVGEDHETIPVHEKEVSIFPCAQEILLKKGYNKEEKEQGSNDWETRTYLLNRAGDFIQSVAVKIETTPSLTGHFFAVLGELEMIPLWPSYNLMHRGLTCDWDSAKEKVRVQCVLDWNYQTSVLYSDLYLEVPGAEKKYLATTSQMSFKLDYTFDNIDSFNVVLCPKSALKEDLGSETMSVNIV